MAHHILFVYAHPDDETFSCGGTIARYAERPDVRISLYCATRGEAGSPGTPPLCRQDELGAFRARELESAAGILGIDHVLIRDYGDKKLKRMPEGSLSDDIEGVIHASKPDAVITFPPHGISGHPDHQAVQKATFQAIHRVDPDAKIRFYYTVIPESTASSASPVHRTPDHEVTTRIDVTPYRQTMMEALQQHRTQHVSIKRVFPGVLAGKWERLRTTEYFQAVRPADSIPLTELL
ncbi:PIG-L deacetylase family protein [Paludifilum halophilum]|uniref:PIG-L domain-containing protein n=1 Tax=Paludifilum halophilum TaxID=1642702 RepID=A0A235BBT8_9BACL|nr:PIG-L family deacetylase [Paludifilum halophilum]OYD09743.1 hypothetical protein CHM34_01735 [Paludifilum halophilum]